MGGVAGWLAMGVATTVWFFGGSPNLLVLGMVSTRFVALLFAAWFLVALMRGNDRAVRVVAERAARLPGVVKGLGVVAAALILFGIPNGLLFASLLLRTMSPSEWNQYMYAQSLTFSAFHLAQTVSLFAAMLWLAARERRGAVAGRS